MVRFEAARKFVSEISKKIIEAEKEFNVVWFDVEMSDISWRKDQHGNRRIMHNGFNKPLIECRMETRLENVDKIETLAKETERLILDKCPPHTTERFEKG